MSVQQNFETESNSSSCSGYSDCSERNHIFIKIE